MPQLDGMTIVAFLAFAALIVAWLVAPTAATAEAVEELRPAA